MTNKTVSRKALDSIKLLTWIYENGFFSLKSADQIAFAIEQGTFDFTESEGEADKTYWAREGLIKRLRFEIIEADAWCEYWRREYTEERAAHNAHAAELCKAEKEVEWLRAENERLEQIDDRENLFAIDLRNDNQRLRATLAWYADEINHIKPIDNDSNIDDDYGYRARKALEGSTSETAVQPEFTYNDRFQINSLVSQFGAGPVIEYVRKLQGIKDGREGTDV